MIARKFETLFCGSSNDLLQRRESQIVQDIK